MFAKILVPLDGSDQAATILSHLRTLVTPPTTSLIFLRVVDPAVSLHTAAHYSAPVYQHTTVSSPLPNLWSAPLNEVVEVARAYLEQLATPWRRQGVAVETLVEVGQAGAAICDAALTYGTDAVAMTMHGASGVTSSLAGSVVAHVLRHATVPVLALRDTRPLHTVRAIQRILLPLDGSPHAEAALPLADTLAWEHEATLVLSRTVPPVTEIEDPDIYTCYHDTVRSELTNEAEAYLGGLKTALEANEAVCETQVVVADAAEGVLTAMKESRADLVVLGVSALRGFGHVLFGWTVDHVLRHATRPVLVMRGNGSS